MLNLSFLLLPHFITSVLFPQVGKALCLLVSKVMSVDTLILLRISLEIININTSLYSKSSHSSSLVLQGPSELLSVSESWFSSVQLFIYFMVL
jgi:hypothetical protein